jgi:hypothetical protein
VYRAAPGAYFLLLCTCAGFAAGLQQSFSAPVSVVVGTLPPLFNRAGVQCGAFQWHGNKINRK